uniref:Uncharacterized protein n=1 Tax=Oryza glumipatula TaxID=40148 RepID=A0A0E0ARP1_9ORYZ
MDSKHDHGDAEQEHHEEDEGDGRPAAADAGDVRRNCRRRSEEAYHGQVAAECCWIAGRRRLGFDAGEDEACAGEDTDEPDEWDIADLGVGPTDANREDSRADRKKRDDETQLVIHHRRRPCN